MYWTPVTCHKVTPSKNKSQRVPLWAGYWGDKCTLEKRNSRTLGTQGRGANHTCGSIAFQGNYTTTAIWEHEKIDMDAPSPFIVRPFSLLWLCLFLPRLGVDRQDGLAQRYGLIKSSLIRRTWLPWHTLTTLMYQTELIRWWTYIFVFFLPFPWLFKLRYSHLSTCVLGVVIGLELRTTWWIYGIFITNWFLSSNIRWKDDSILIHIFKGILAFWGGILLVHRTLRTAFAAIIINHNNFWRLLDVQFIARNLKLTWRLFWNSRVMIIYKYTPTSPYTRDISRLLSTN